MLTCTKIAPITKPALEKMIMNREKNRNTLIYYLYLRKSERNHLSSEELEIIDRELAKGKTGKPGETLQSTAECITSANQLSDHDPDKLSSPLKKPKKLKKPTTFRSIEESVDPEKLPAVVLKKDLHSPVRRGSKFSLAAKNNFQDISPQSDKFALQNKLSPVFQS